jgi:hypothetical protein
MKLRARVDRLEREYPPPPPPTAQERREQRQWCRVTDRFYSILEQTLPLMSEAEQKQVTDSLKEFVEKRRGALDRWLSDLRMGRSRLPELPPETMKQVVLSWFHPDVDRAPVCNRCGLEYPDLKSPPTSTWKLLPGKVPFQGPPPWYDLPRIFDACPGCGA